MKLLIFLTCSWRMFFNHLDNKSFNLISTSWLKFGKVGSIFPRVLFQVWSIVIAFISYSGATKKSGITVILEQLMDFHWHYVIINKYRFFSLMHKECWHRTLLCVISVWPESSKKLNHIICFYRMEIKECVSCSGK